MTGSTSPRNSVTQQANAAGREDGASIDGHTLPDRNGVSSHEQYEPLDSGSEDEFHAADGEAAHLSSLQLDPERERVRAWAAAQIPEPGAQASRPPLPGGVPAERTAQPDSNIQIDQERKAAILGAMKNIRLDYIPPWAIRISENDFETEVKAVVAKKPPGG